MLLLIIQQMAFTQKPSLNKQSAKLFISAIEDRDMSELKILLGQFQLSKSLRRDIGWYLNAGPNDIDNASGKERKSILISKLKADN